MIVTLLPPPSCDDQGTSSMPDRTSEAVLRQFSAAALAILCGAGTFVLAQVPAQSAVCLVTGRVSSGNTPLPGVSLMAARDGTVATATATDVAGSYRLKLSPGEYRITADLPAFATFEEQVSLSNASDAECSRTLNVQMTLRSRAQSSGAGEAGRPAEVDRAGGAGGVDKAGGVDGAGGARGGNRAGGP